MSRDTPQFGSDPQPTRRATSKREMVVFAAVLLALEGLYFSDALRPGWILSAADWLLATESFRAPGEPDYEPANRLLTDIACQMDPWMDLAAREWQDGRVPLWNPYSGCGAPLLANAQSAVFNPVNFIYFLTRSPYAWVAMAILKLFIAGVGAFLLASEIGLGPLGRWFAGLTFPFSGFVVVWLNSPLASAGVWFPILLWRVERLLLDPQSRNAGWLALAIALALLAGHPETAAHVLMVAGVYLLWRAWPGWRITTKSDANNDTPSPHSVEPSSARLVTGARAVGLFALASTVGFLIAAIQLVPLAEYLGRSQAWAERSHKLRGVFEIKRPDFLAMPQLAVPYVYGSYRRGHPHVEKAIGVENFNETAGGYTGLATIAVLVPAAVLARRRHRWVWFWIVVDVVALCATYRLPPVDNAIRLVPILNVAQNQRLLLVVSLAHCLLGAAGLESWGEPAAQRRRLRFWLAGALAGGAILLAGGAVAVRYAEPQIRQRATNHFAHQAEIRGLSPDALAGRAEEMVTKAVRFFPRYYATLAIYATFIATWLSLASNLRPGRCQSIVWIALALGDLFLFGRGYNPAIPLRQYFPEDSQSVTTLLRDPAGKALEPYRVLSLEEEFPPNVLTRFGIADIRNYDAIEVRDSLAFFAPLWDDGSGQLTSNSWTTGDRVAANLDLLSFANVRYLISTREPLADVFARHGSVSVVQIKHWGRVLQSPGDDPLGDGQGNQIEHRVIEYRPGRIVADVEIPSGRTLLVFSQTFMPGWVATIDGVACDVQPFRGAFVSVPIVPGKHRVVFDYAPASFRAGLWLSFAGVLAALSLFTVGLIRRKSAT